VRVQRVPLLRRRPALAVQGLHDLQRRARAPGSPPGGGCPGPPG
jgi:hypothetical protein